MTIFQVCFYSDKLVLNKHKQARYNIGKINNQIPAYAGMTKRKKNLPLSPPFPYNKTDFYSKIQVLKSKI